MTENPYDVVFFDRSSLNWVSALTESHTWESHNSLYLFAVSSYYDSLTHWYPSQEC